LTIFSLAFNSMAAGRSFIWLAHCYQKQYEYALATEYYKRGLELYKESVNWGLNDSGAAIFLLMAYKNAALACELSEDYIGADMFNREYEYFSMLRDAEMEDLEEFERLFGWD